MGLRDIAHNLGQFLAIIGISGIAVTLFVGLKSNAVSIESRVNEVYKEGNVADLWLTTSKYDKDDENLISSSLNADAEIDHRFYSFVQINKRNFYAVVRDGLPSIDSAYDIETDLSTSKDSHYFLVDSTLLSNGGVFTDPLSIGQSIDVSFDISSYGLSTYSSFLTSFVKEGGSNVFANDSLSLPFSITGSMKTPENIGKASYSTSVLFTSSRYFYDVFKDLIEENYTSQGETLIFSTLHSLLGWGTGDISNDDVSSFPAPNQYLVRTASKQTVDSSKDILKKAFSSKDSDNLLLTTDKDSMSFSLTMNNEVSQAKSFCYVFPLVFFFTALLVTLTTISQMILKQRLQIGTLKGLGVYKRQIYGHYMTITMTLLGIGTLIGEVLGPLIIPSIMDNKYQIIYSLPKRTYLFPWLEWLLTAALFLLSGALVTILVCHSEVKLKPADSMRNAPVANIFHGKNEEKKAGNALALSIKMAFRNIILSPVKSFMVVAGVAGCTALLACGFGIDDTIDYGIDHDLSMMGNSALTVTMPSGQDYESLISSLKSVDGVEGVEPYANGASTISSSSSGKEITKYYYVLPLSPSRFSLPAFSDEQVALSKKVASSISVEVGDYVDFTLGSSSYKHVEVGAIYEAFSYHAVVLKANNSILKDTTISYSSAWVDIASGSTSKEVSTNITNRFPKASISTHEDSVSKISDIVSGVKVMTGAVKVFAILLALVVLYNLALLNFRERYRDIATLKVLGFSTGEISSSLLWESLSLTIVGVVIGLALGYPFLIAVMSQNTVDLVSYLYTIKISSYIYSFLLTFVVALLVNLFFGFRSQKVKMVESLKSVD
jgi:putative ABC transport system permease protein